MIVNREMTVSTVEHILTQGDTEVWDATLVGKNLGKRWEREKKKKKTWMKAMGMGEKNNRYSKFEVAG